MSEYGGFWRRTLAYILDSIILNIAVSMVSFVLGLGLGVQMQAGGGDTEMIQALSGLGGDQL